MRRIEQQNPDIEFDWPRILKGGGTPATEPRPPVPPTDVRRGRQHEGRRGPPPARHQPTAAPKPIEALPPSPPPVDNVDHDDAERDGMPSVESMAGDDRTPSTIAGDVDTPAHARLGPEGVGRLRARHAEIRARLAERVTDPARRDELALTVERLNPDTWKTSDEVAAGLEQYEVVLASLREVVGRRRRKRRRGGRRGQGTPPAGQDAVVGAPDEESEDEPAEQDGDDPGPDDSGGV